MASKIAGHSNKPWDELPVLPMDKVNTLMLSTAPLGISLFFRLRSNTTICSQISFRVGNHSDSSSTRTPTCTIDDVTCGSEAGLVVVGFVAKRSVHSEPC